MSPWSHLRRQRILAVFLAVLLSLPVIAVPAGAEEGGNGEDNAAVAVNQKNGSSVFDFAFEVRRVTSGVVDQTNAAVAYSNCESCQTVAIAVQIVLVAGGADTITPTNVAVAVNESCTSCHTLALAYQFVFGTGDVLEFTKEGRKRLKEIQREFKDLGDSDLSVDEIRAQAGELALEIGMVLSTELVPRGPGEDADEEEVQEGEDGGETGREDEPAEPDETLPEETAPAPAEPAPPETETGDPQAEPQPPAEPLQPEAEPAPGSEPTAPDAP